MKKRPRRAAAERGLHTHRSEQMLIEHLDELPGDRLLCTTQGRAQLAAVAALRSADRRVMCHFLDLYLAEESRSLHGDCGGRLDIRCATDFPEGEFDAVAMPFRTTGESELVRELMQTAQQRLAEGSRLAVATDNPRDTFFHGEMQKLFPRVTRIADKRGVLYVGTKRGPLKRVRDFSTIFSFRDGERLLNVFSRPGVFSHRRIDTGTRALLEAVTVRPGMHILDLGCGAGPVAAALAARAAGVRVEAVDANPRAVACTLRTCELNGVTSVNAHLDAEARCGERGTVDLAAGNPPYFSQFRIAALFLDSAAESLKPGGLAVFVTKQPLWFEEHMAGRFVNVSAAQVRGYAVVSGIKAG